METPKIYCPLCGKGIPKPQVKDDTEMSGYPLMVTATCGNGCGTFGITKEDQ